MMNASLSPALQRMNSRFLSPAKPIRHRTFTRLMQRLAGHCALCGQFTSIRIPPLEVICQPCHDDLPWKMGDPMDLGFPVQTALDYLWPVNTIVSALKYQSRLHVRTVLAHALLQLPRPDVDALLPVPVSTERLRDRGFDQVDLVAQVVSEHWQLPIWRGVGREERQRQQTLNRSARMTNLQGAFYLQPNALRPATGADAPLKLLLLDDVLTTGATLKNLADCLVIHCPDMELSAYVVASGHQ